MPELSTGIKGTEPRDDAPLIPFGGLPRTLRVMTSFEDEMLSWDKCKALKLCFEIFLRVCTRGRGRHSISESRREEKVNAKTGAGVDVGWSCLHTGSLPSKPRPYLFLYTSVARFAHPPLPLFHLSILMVMRRGGRKNVKKGVQFTVMVVGQSFFFLFVCCKVDRRFFDFYACTGGSGTGRTTFVNTLCESEVLTHKDSDSPETAHVEQGIKIKPVNVGTYSAGSPHRSHS